MGHHPILKVTHEGEIIMAALFLHGRLLAFLGELLNGNPGRWVRRNPVISYAAYPFLAVLLCLGAAPARADMLPSLAWNCWVSGQNPAQINCIHERGQLQKNTPEDPDSELEAQVLGQLQERKLSGETAKLGGVEWRNIDVLHKGARWAVKIHSYPQGEVLGESRLNRLVKAVLCPIDIPCTVALRNATQRGIVEAK